MSLSITGRCGESKSSNEQSKIIYYYIRLCVNVVATEDRTVVMILVCLYVFVCETKIKAIAEQRKE